MGSFHPAGPRGRGARAARPPGRPASRRWGRCAMSEALVPRKLSDGLFQPAVAERPATADAPSRPRRRRSLGNPIALPRAVITGGLRELWAHKLRSTLTLTLLMLGVFALVVMISVLDGVMDKISTGFAGMSWDGPRVLPPKAPKTSEEQKRFAMSTALPYEDLARITAPHPKVLGYSPRAVKRTAVRTTGGTERIFVSGVTSEYSFLMNRPIGMGRGITPNDQRRHSTVAVVGASLGAKLFGGSDPVGRDAVIEGVPYRIVGVLASGQIFNEEMWQDANGMLVPLETYMDRLDADHQLTLISVKLRNTRDRSEEQTSELQPH